MVDILKNIMNIAYRVRDMQIAGTLSMVLFGVVLVFGIMNCVLGYRLLRFWMMIFGFLIGAGIGLFAIHQIGFGEKVYYAVGMIGVGLVLAILSFAVFKAGIFIMGAGIGLTITVYINPSDYFFQLFHLSSGGSRSWNAGASLRKRSDHCGNQYSGWYFKWLFCCQAGKNGGNSLLESFFPLGSPLWEC